MSTDGNNLDGAARGMAFTLLRAAFLDLAQAHLDADPEGGPTVLRGLQDSALGNLRDFLAERPDMADPALLQAAVLKIRAVLLDAQALRAGPHDEAARLPQAAGVAVQ